VFGPHGFIAEGEGVHPDIEVLQDSKLVMQGRDPQLERAVEETLELVATKGAQIAKPPAFPVKAKRPTGVVP
jgi:tricorn protease